MASVGVLVRKKSGMIGKAGVREISWVVACVILGMLCAGAQWLGTRPGLEEEGRLTIATIARGVKSDALPPDVLVGSSSCDKCMAVVAEYHAVAERAKGGADGPRLLMIVRSGDSYPRVVPDWLSIREVDGRIWWALVAGSGPPVRYYFEGKSMRSWNEGATADEK